MIWLVWLHVAPLPGCKTAPESGDPALECAVRAETVAEVREALDTALRKHRYRVDEVEACVPFDPAHWDDAADPDGRVRAAAAAALGQGRVHFASFGRAPQQ
ncbi:MAG: hypothetical protein ACREBE_13040 [bacterium]